MSTNAKRAIRTWVLNMVDWAITVWAIRSGLAAEANPILAPFILGFRGFMIKALGMGLVLGLLASFGSAGSLVLRGLQYVYVGVVVWNVGLVSYVLLGGMG